MEQKKIKQAFELAEQVKQIQEKITSIKHDIDGLKTVNNTNIHALHMYNVALNNCVDAYNQQMDEVRGKEVFIADLDDMIETLYNLKSAINGEFEIMYILEND